MSPIDKTKIYYTSFPVTSPQQVCNKSTGKLRGNVCNEFWAINVWVLLETSVWWQQFWLFSWESTDQISAV